MSILKNPFRVKDCHICAFIKEIEGEQVLNVHAVEDETYRVVASLDANHWDKEGTWVTWLYVDPEWRHEGLATQMLLHLETLALAAGKKGIGLTVEHENTAARKLYEKLGYVACWSTSNDSTHMTKHLI